MPKQLIIIFASPIPFRIKLSFNYPANIRLTDRDKEDTTIPADIYTPDKRINLTFVAIDDSELIASSGSSYLSSNDSLKIYRSFSK